MNTIVSFITKARFYLIASSLAQHAFLWLIAGWGVYIACGLVDFLVPLPLAGRRFLLLVLAAWGVFCALRFFWLNRPAARDAHRTILRIQETFPELGDRLLSAWQLSGKNQRGISAELIEELTRSVSRILSNGAPSSVISLGRVLYRPLVLLGVLAALTSALTFLPPRIMRPSFTRILLSYSTSGWDRWFGVAPGSGTFPSDAPVAIILRQKKHFPGNPVLSVRSEKDGWQAVELSELPDRGFSYSVDRLTERLDYRVRWGDWESPVFSLVPARFPQLGEFSITYRYPGYTGLPGRTVKDDPNISAPAGTRVELSARSNVPLKKADLYASWNIRYPVQVREGVITAHLTVRRSGTYHLALEGEDAMVDPDPPRYSVNVSRDLPPEVELLSPAEDLVAAPDAEIPLVVQAHDDFGLTKIELVYTADGRTVRIPVLGCDKGTYQCMTEYRWKLSSLDTKPGRKLRYSINAWDNDLIGGPNFSATPERTIEIADYALQHDAIEEDLKDLRTALLEVLADQTEAKGTLDDLAVKFSTASYQSLLSKQQKIRSDAQSPLERLDSLLKRMENDPYTDFSTLSEYKGLRSHLEYVRENPMREAVSSLEKKDLAEAGRKQDEIIASLEKMSLLSEDIWQYQRMRDIFDSASAMEKAGTELAEQLDGNPVPSELRRTLDKIREMLDEINRQLTKLPHELPEDFVNSPSVKQINMQETKNAADRLREALDKGDWAAAQELASELRKQLASMMKTLQQAGENVGFSAGSARGRQDELAAQEEKLKAIAGEQEEIIAAGGQLDSARRKALFVRQERLLSDLAEKQKALIARADKAVPGIRKDLPGLAGQAQQSLVLMRKVLDEFRQKRAYHSQKYLEDIVKQWDDASTAASAQKTAGGAPLHAALAKDLAEIRDGERSLLEALRDTPRSGLFTPVEQEKLSGLAARQNDLSGRTDTVRRSLEEFSRRSTAVAPETMQNLGLASGEMRSAGGRYSEEDTPEALESGRRALELLRQGQEGLQSAQQEAGRQGEKGGTPTASPIQVRSSGGMSGFHTAPVKLPGAKDYKPPREFRQEIMEALKEKYPAQYEKMIREYYRKLAE